MVDMENTKELSNGIQKIEEKMLKFWKDREIFKKSLEQTRGRKRYVFYDGPPTANGRPGIHHFIGRVFKDLYPRYKTMRGYYVERRAGWDTQGIPVELEVEKKLGFKSKKDIEVYGIAKFNQKAKESVWEYKEEWERFTERVGFWLDLSDPYITYDATYIESLWWIIQQFDKKGLLYEGHKVLPWCPRCGTALSSHEVAQEYEDVTETSVYVKFRLIPNDKFQISNDTFLLAWTTTPWTLPGNVALAVGKDIEYVLVYPTQPPLYDKGGAKEGYIIAKERVEVVLGKDFEVTKTLKGKDLVGIVYEPLFDIKALQSEKSHKVYPADFVTTIDGTGIVHTAVMYGEDDYILGKKLGLPMHHTVNEQGLFTKDVKGFEGRPVKEAEKDIIANLKERSLLLKTEQYTHSYPHCWRCHKPLLYYARDSWFVAMSKLKKKLWKNNLKVNWIPSHLREGRFGEFIKEVKDWAFSRERYWGTPLPVWRCQGCSHHIVIGSLAELETHRYREPNVYYLVRHGWSENNNQVLGAGSGIHSSDVKNDHFPLRPEGREQAKKVAFELKEKGVDMIYSSPFIRTRETAGIIGDALGVSITVDDRLREINDLEDGTGFDKSHHDNTNYDLDSRKIKDYETLRETRSRMSALILELDRKYEDKKIAIVSHGHPLWMLATFMENLPDNVVISTQDKYYSEQGGMRVLGLKNYPYNKKGELDLHRPYIDDIHLKCPKCSAMMKRVKEVCDVWFDSGGMPFAQWHYPFANHDKLKDNFPADYIAEGIDQTRGWFYSLLAVATALGYKAPYKNVLSYGHVLDEKGKKMSKSLGNVINPWDVIEKIGVDPVRWYFCIVNNPGEYKLFSLRDVEKQRGFLMTLLNSLRFYELYSTSGNVHGKSAPKPENPIDIWIVSRLHNLISYVTEALDDYDPTDAARTIERFVIDDFSNWWIRRSRDRFSGRTAQSGISGPTALLRYLLVEISKLLAPMMPFMADHMYKKVSNKKESVHLESWPKFKEKYFKPDLEQKMVELRQYVALGLGLRKEANIKVRQPLASLTLKKTVDGSLISYLKDEVNVKEIFHNPAQETDVILDTKITRPLMLEGYAREIMRQIQDMRKEAGYKVDDKIYAAWQSDNADIKNVFEQFQEKITNDTLLKELTQGTLSGTLDIEKEFELVPGAKVWLRIRK